MIDRETIPHWDERVTKALSQDMGEGEEEEPVCVLPPIIVKTRPKSSVSLSTRFQLLKVPQVSWLPLTAIDYTVVNVPISNLQTEEGTFTVRADFWTSEP